MEFRLVTRSGKVIWIEYRCQAVLSGDGGWLSWRISNRDITRLKDLQQQMEQETKLFLAGEVNYFSLIHLEDAGRVRREIERYTVSSVDDFELEYRIKDARGVYLYFYDKTVIIRGPASEVIRCHTYLVDITARREIEQALLQSEERLSLALDGAQTATWYGTSTPAR